MAQNQAPKTVPGKGPGWIEDLTQRVKLIARLMTDSRVNPLLKLIPIASLVYLIVPLDFLFGPIDDAAVIWIGANMFVELCPPGVVQEHMAALNMAKAGPSPARRPEDEVIDAEYREVRR